MTSIDIPNSVTEIGEWAFRRCSGLTSVTISASITRVYDFFYECDNITSVYYPAEDPVEGYNLCSNVVYENATLYVPETAVEKCKETSPWYFFSSIEAYDFAGIEDVTADAGSDHPCEIYTLGGIKIADSTDGLSPGIYIIRRGNRVSKIAVN